VKDIKARAIYRSATVKGSTAPYNTLTLKVYYPCSFGDSFEERNSGFIPADASRAPFPVVVIMPGINVSHESYGWLALKLAESGFAVVTYSWVTMEMEDLVSVSPGVRINRLTPRRYGKKPSCPALPAIFSELNRMQKKSVLAGQLDLNKVVIGGHSAGGTMALLNANPEWFPQVLGVFSYAAHTAANVMLGWEEDSIMPLRPDMPMLILGGNRDGVIAASSHRYGDENESSPTARIERTFHEGLGGTRGDRFLLIVEGANHFSLSWPRDNSTGRPFLDKKTRGSDKKIRKYLARVIVNFCDHVCTNNAMSTANLQGLCNIDNPLAAIADHK
jgi:pimeloyl-ACP methyl ester carboxylesterase